MSGLALALFLAGGAGTATGFERFEPVQPGPDETVSATHCTDDRRWCAELSKDVESNRWTLAVFAGRPTAPTTPAATYPLPDEEQDADYGLWPKILRLDDPSGGLLMGVETQVNAGYSGGGGSAATLHLLHVVPVARETVSAREVWSAPLSAALQMRACFSERDTRNRAGACQDEYLFNATLTPSEPSVEGLPRLTYGAVATAYPADASRRTDSTTRPPLKPRDLKRVRDARCSVIRVLTYAPGKGAYVPDSPLPDCSDYTEP